ncbi:Transcription factor IIIC zinc-finger [Penicillium brevicompactum]|uniref:Transcription factor IIIC zinc-finger n=1 Tax=Penicillium brevicompactum TaxID=5074 RepID=A0A9W9UNS7_PENBR|nr:Transcription factor IIIC zinc-finger [Penicillium brevicompactum]
MLRPVALSVFPSCREAISWSADGEIAIAAGDHFQILTPTSIKDAEASSSEPEWTVTRVRANLFTNAEWPAFLPGDRDQFSIAAEQSTANIIALAWSPAGLGKYRRCVLLVLTSNLVLSIWEPLGLQQKWTRVGIVNHAFWPQPEHSQDPTDHGFRKTDIRSFTWCDSPKASISTSEGSSTLPALETRWGASLLAVVNDLNEISLIQFCRTTPADASSTHYELQILATHTLENPERENNLVCPGSLFEKAMRERERTTSLCCGPWMSPSNEALGNSDRHVAMIAAACGTQLRLLKVEAIFESSNQNNIQQCTLSASMEEHPIEQSNEGWAQNNVTGPLRWLHTKSSATMTLAVGIMAGLITITMSRTMYSASSFNLGDLKVREWPIYEPEDDDDPDLKERHLEPIYGMLPARNERGDACKLHLGTLGGVGLATELNQIQTGSELQQPQWKRMLDEFQEQYDLDHGLGGMLTSRIWGLATYRGITAAIFTNHPTDMVEYRVSSDDVSTLVFSEEFGRIPNTRAVFTPRAPDGQIPGHDRVGEVISFVLPGADGEVDPDQETQRLIYVVACRAIVGESDKTLRAYAQRSLERLAIVTGADLTEEIGKCHGPPSLIAAKSADHLSGPGGHVYEKCEVCDAGIGWCSAQQARCSEGHIWRKSNIYLQLLKSSSIVNLGCMYTVRCGVSFLAIQEPGISKYCSFCGTEALDEERVASTPGHDLGKTTIGLFQTFDTCLYCAGKFQATY